MLLIIAVGLSSGCMTMPLVNSPGATKDSINYIKTELYFGLSSPTGEVTEEQWQLFVNDYITPRFEDNLTVVDGRSQYWSEQGDFVREQSKIVVLVHDNTPAADASIEFIRASYRKLFDKDRVIRVSTPVMASFRESVVLPEMNLLANLENEQINESSGLAFSTRGERVLWTHNDSGDEPRFFALDERGHDLGTFRVTNAQAVDWEDMCAGVVDGAHCLLFADVGDNQKKRSHGTIYIVQEPDPAAKGEAVDVKALQAVDFRYEDGPHNCESVALEPLTRTLYLVSKNWGWSCNVYALQLPMDPPASMSVATFVAEIGLPMTTAMDFSPDGRRAVVLTYGDAYEFEREEGETWADAFRKTPRPLAMPKREQGESICYGPEGLTLYLTSEQLPAPLWEVIVPPGAE